MELGETIATYDVDLALRGESGKFEVTSPIGEIYYVTCKPNTVIAKAVSLLSQIYPQAFLIKKIAESLSFEQGTIAPKVTNQEEATPAIHTPFLIGDRPIDNESKREMPSSGLRQLEVWGFELFYSENGTESRTPSAFVFVQKAQAENGESQHEKLVTAPCASFNELDSQIRSLHAQLEEICLRAKKKFYKTYAAASA